MTAPGRRARTRPSEPPPGPGLRLQRGKPGRPVPAGHWAQDAAARPVGFHAAPSREDGCQHSAWREPQMAAAPVPAGRAGGGGFAPSLPARGRGPAVGGPRGVFRKAGWRLQRKPPGCSLARRQPPRCVNRRFKSERRSWGSGVGARARGRVDDLAD